MHIHITLITYLSHILCLLHVNLLLLHVLCLWYILYLYSFCIPISILYIFLYLSCVHLSRLSYAFSLFLFFFRLHIMSLVYVFFIFRFYDLLYSMYYLIFRISRRSIRLILLLSYHILSYVFTKAFMCFHILYFSYTFLFLYFLYFTCSYPFRVLCLVLSIYCIHVLFMYYFHIPIFKYCSFHILFSCYTFHMIVIYCAFHLILSSCTLLLVLVTVYTLIA